MLPTYAAMLRDGKLDWGVDGPPPLPRGTIPIRIMLLTLPASATGGPAMSAAIAAIAATGGPSDFGDPAEWQREVRGQG